ncbi:hypothetical protein BC936DRAFT_146329 [Jimgerdemannia flammicorona]|uniref:Uncharacterized protein n=2 Tax=Jimgerdemannia flammicorona TaxID=994334 RepID=A0A433D7W5_9FUNG|nr:hypothetical protein BC936DRAFT_146329 [Jimgerdemannia flammicorona]RUS35133.1 hypothetical protein BC938DRAFT_475294 [Jimgerdemannia flammicorona]
MDTIHPLPIEILSKIFSYVPNPSEWTLVNRTFWGISRDPATVAEWAVVQFDKWRAFDHIIAKHRRALTPTVVTAMLAKGAKLSRHLVQTVLQHPSFTSLGSLTILELLKAASEKYQPFVHGQNDRTRIERLIHEFPGKTKNNAVTILIAKDLNELLELSYFYPIKSAIKIDDRGPIHEDVLAVLLVFAKPWMQQLFRDGFRVTESTSLYTLLHKLFFISGYPESYLKFVIQENGISISPSNYERALLHALRGDRSDIADALLDIVLPFDIEPSVHGAIDSFLSVAVVYLSNLKDALVTNVYRRFPSPQVLAGALAKCYQTGGHAEWTYTSNTITWSASTLRYFLDNLDWSFHQPGAHYLFEVAVRQISEGDVNGMDTREMRSVVEECMRDHEFRSRKRQWIRMFECHDDDRFKWWIDLVVQAAHPVVMDTEDNREMPLTDFLRQWAQDSESKVGRWAGTLYRRDSRYYHKFMFVKSKCTEE